MVGKRAISIGGVRIHLIMIMERREKRTLTRAAKGTGIPYLGSTRRRSIFLYQKGSTCSNVARKEWRSS
jgi:hypothetical protein